ncbi:MAG: hypothetical protein H7122_16655 [Chitinophagaceae bacterium]|nr:hypothetical protein [Chitinophagaceae bacterium]
MPWLSFSAIEHIKNIITADMTLFEFGSGGSTLFWASRVKHVISIEHDKLWHEKMKNEISNAGITNVDYYLIEAVNNPKLLRKDFLNPADYSSGDELYSGKDFEQYVKKIDELPDQSLDVIVIDGRARPSCILHSIPKLKPKGHLIIDNSDREYYLKPFQFGAKNWKQWDHYGPAPFTYGFTQTSILQKI